MIIRRKINGWYYDLGISLYAQKFLSLISTPKINSGKKNSSRESKDSPPFESLDSLEDVSMTLELATPVATRRLSAQESSMDTEIPFDADEDNSDDAYESDIKNMYEELDEDLKTVFSSPSMALHHITIPFRMLIVAPTGSGKTNLLYNLIDKLNNNNYEKTFYKIFIFTQNKNEPLYIQMERNRDDIIIDEGYDNIPFLEDLETFDCYDGNRQFLFCFDDMLLEKHQEKIESFYIRGRKLNASVIYLTQNYLGKKGEGTPLNIRKSSDYVALLTLDEDVKPVLAKFNFCDNKEWVYKIYQDTIPVPFRPLFIDMKKRQYRKGLL